MSKIIIDCDSILELINIKDSIKTGGYTGEICVYNNEQLIKECETYDIKGKETKSTLYYIMGCKVIKQPFLFFNK